MRSFYLVTPDALSSVLGEFKSLKEAETHIRKNLSEEGTYLVMEVVRSAVIEAVPESTRVKLSATRTRSSGGKPRKAKATGATEAPIV